MHSGGWGVVTITRDLNLEGSQPFSLARWAASDLGLPAQAQTQGSGVPGAPVLQWDKSLTSLCLRCPCVRDMGTPVNSS